MTAPRLIDPIPPQVSNELGSFHPFDLSSYFESATPMRFSAQQSNGNALPKGMICMSDGRLTGIPARNTIGNYDIQITATNESGSTSATFVLQIRESLANTESDAPLNDLKAQIWQAVDKNLPIPDLSELFDREISALEIYYLLERWSMIKIWDAFNLDSPGELKPIQLAGASSHYNVYDRGSCLVATPKDLFSHERTSEDAFKTARALAREAYMRGWTMDLVGIDKLTRVAWAEVQLLNQIYGKHLDVVNYTVTDQDVRVYNELVRRETRHLPGPEASGD